jgi:plasmid stabilization system protein ParE
MRSLTIKFSPAAQQDLHKIYQHSVNNWGEVQANKYLTAIQLHLSLLLKQPFLGRERPNLFQNNGLYGTYFSA